MLGARSALARLAAQSLKGRAVSARCYHGKNPHAPSTMNDLPTPQGDFFELHARRQARYNRALIIGIVTFAGTMVVAKESGLLHFNWSPPDTYE
ncbi:uncharacterized protein LOC129802297 [Phlebotomus papatasi]|uniref:Deltamethrin resistance protein prag01 domain-containing protein n=1 Tax=Phlebotomus papatasi TaxID=29031 RepID=A0A1B0CZ34_PHLPP|nr:uncharacterized protein LOC129802297 [Phlebotomus papatasi]